MTNQDATAQRAEDAIRNQSMSTYDDAVLARIAREGITPEPVRRNAVLARDTLSMGRANAAVRRFAASTAGRRAARV